jgi:hypothetical protein
MTMVKFFFFACIFAMSGAQGHTMRISSNATAHSLQSQKHSHARISKRILDQLVEAVQDEVYDYGYERDFYSVGLNVGPPRHWKSRLVIYVQPGIEDGLGKAIYKLMPYGEVLRVFEVEDDGSVVLDGNPQHGFPVTQPSHKTLFDDEEEICDVKRKWLKRSFQIDTSPTDDLRQKAVARQSARTGFSDWQYRHSTQPEKPN